MSKKVINESFETPITRSYDVVVVGGGSAGCCAALKAARKGVKVLLIEREGYLGGMVTGGMIGSIGMHTVAPGKMEHYAEIRKRLKTDPKSVLVTTGIPLEIHRRLIQTGGGLGYFGELAAYVSIHIPSFKRLLMDMMEEAGVDLMFYAQGVKPIMKGNVVSGVVVQGKGQREAIESTIVIDATGDGDIASVAGAEFEIGRPIDHEMICMTLMFSMGGIDMEKYFAAEVKETTAWPPRSLDEHFADMRTGNSYWFGSSTFLSERAQIPESLRKEMMAHNWAMNFTRGHIFACNTPIKDELIINCTQVFKKSGICSWDLTEAVKIGYKQVEILEKMYKLAVPGFENSYIREIAPLMGVRETRRITGDYIVTEDDVISCRKFEDGVMGSGHPIDTSEGDEDRFQLIKGGQWYEVPYRSILVKGLENILTAGRCISADHAAIGSIRPTAACMVLGEAAGLAAANAVKKGVTPRQLDGRDIRRETGWADMRLADLSHIEVDESQRGWAEVLADIPGYNLKD